MEYIEKFNFNDKFQPHGEDQVCYNYDKNGDLTILIYYDELKENILLKFKDCAYHYFTPLPGFQADQLILDFNFKSSRLYEIFDSNMLVGSEDIYQNTKYKPNRRHFFLYLEWENVSFNIIAKSVECIESAQV